MNIHGKKVGGVGGEGETDSRYRKDVSYQSFYQLLLLPFPPPFPQLYINVLTKMLHTLFTNMQHTHIYTIYTHHCVMGGFTVIMNFIGVPGKW